MPCRVNNPMPLDLRRMQLGLSGMLEPENSLTYDCQYFVPPRSVTTLPIIFHVVAPK